MTNDTMREEFDRWAKPFMWSSDHASMTLAWMVWQASRTTQAASEPSDEAIEEVFQSVANDDPDVHLRFARALISNFGGQASDEAEIKRLNAAWGSAVQQAMSNGQAASILREQRSEDEALMRDALEALRGAVLEADKHECAHDETYRGGTIWTICRTCGAKWADDETCPAAQTRTPRLLAADAAILNLRARLEKA